MYREIEDARELETLSIDLTRRIRRQLKHQMRKVVGYPSGRAEVAVNFEASHGTNLHWWSSELSTDGEAHVNLIGRGDPESNAYLMIDLQFNVPIKRFGRAHGGAFVEDIESGAKVLAHRGIVSRGNSRVKKDVLLRETMATRTPVITSKGIADLFLVASLDSKNLVDDIAAFALKIRRAADVAIAATQQQDARSPFARIDSHLGQYVDEFGGKRKLPRREAVVVEVRHGRVVSQLKEALAGAGKLLKSQKVDLAISNQSSLLIFEVKTSVSPADLYTAIGQLSLHSIAAGEQFPKARIRKVLVVPSTPTAQMRKRLKQALGIEVLTFEWKGPAHIQFEARALNTLLGG